MSGSWNMDECGDQMTQGWFLLIFEYYFIFLRNVFYFLV